MAVSLCNLSLKNYFPFQDIMNRSETGKSLIATPVTSTMQFIDSILPGTIALVIRYYIQKKSRSRNSLESMPDLTYSLTFQYIQGLPSSSREKMQTMPLLSGLGSSAKLLIRGTRYSYDNYSYSTIASYTFWKFLSWVWQNRMSSPLSSPYQDAGKTN